MSSRALLVAFLTNVLLLVGARDSEAFLEWIHELSGPGPFWGVSGYFKTDFETFFKEYGGAVVFQYGEVERGEDVWLRTSGAVLFAGEEPGKSRSAVTWFALEPTLEFRLLGTLDRHFAFAGGGVSYNNFSGSGFDGFNRFAWKLNAGANFALRNRDRLKLHGNFKYFPTRFTPSDFGLGPGPSARDGGEWVVGVSISYAFVGR